MLDLVEQHASQAFSLYVEQRLKRTSGETGEQREGRQEEEEEQGEADEQFAGVDNEHEHLVSVAFLARLQPLTSLMGVSAAPHSLHPFVLDGAVVQHLNPFVRFFHRYRVLLRAAATVDRSAFLYPH